MDTPQPPSIVAQPLKRKERSPSPALRTPSHTSTGSRPSPTSLPSIRHFLPPQPDVQLGERYHPSRQQAGSAFPAGPSAGIPRLDFLPPPAQPPAERAHSGIVADSDGDGDSEQAARPKQKRRRQALSCTECKRRKIKCDRAHPCTPCIRRGDQSKCQWHVIEPVDKYVSRTEYDELKARVDQLESYLLSRTQPGFTSQPRPESSSSQTQAQVSTRLLGAAGAAQGQQGITAPVPMLPYNPISPPAAPPSQPQGSPFPALLAGAPRPVSAGSKDYGAMALRRPNSPAGRTALPPLASLAHGHGPTPFDGPPPPSRLHREQREHREQQYQPYAPLPPQSPLQQPLQQPHQQTKNYHAQTLTPLGECLRHCIPLQGPAAISRLPRHPNSSSSTRRLHLLMRGARGRRCLRAPAFRDPLPFPGRRRGAPSVRSESGSSPSYSSS